MTAWAAPRDESRPAPNSGCDTNDEPDDSERNGNAHDASLVVEDACRFAGGGYQ
jgi:hypothetical protein